MPFLCTPFGDKLTLKTSQRCLIPAVPGKEENPGAPMSSRVVGVFSFGAGEGQGEGPFISP